MKKQERGITLIALIITIIVLLILAVVAIAAVRDGGIIQHAQSARTNYSAAEVKEEAQLVLSALKMESSIRETDEVAFLQNKLGAEAIVESNGKGNFTIKYKGYEVLAENYGIVSVQKIEQGQESEDEPIISDEEWNEGANEEYFIWKSDDPTSEDYGVIIGFTQSVSNCTILRFPTRTTQIMWGYDENRYGDLDVSTSRSFTNTIEKMEIPETVISMNFSADASTFSSVKEVEYRNGTTTVRGTGLRTLEKVIIPDSVTSIGKSAFYGCSGLTSIKIPEGVSALEGDNLSQSGMFSNCTNLREVTLPSTVKNIGLYAFQKCTSLTSIKIPEGVENIGYWAFGLCTSLNDVEMPNSLTTIEGGAFISCSALTTITIPDNVTSIGKSAFSSCTSLASVTMPDRLITIEENAFYSCTSLASITIPDTVTSIGASAFSSCTALSNITIPESVTNMGEFVFVGWLSNQTINCRAATKPDGWNSKWSKNKTTHAITGNTVESEPVCAINWGYTGA